MVRAMKINRTATNATTIHITLKYALTLSAPSCTTSTARLSIFVTPCFRLVGAFIFVCCPASCAITRWFIILHDLLCRTRVPIDPESYC